MAAGPKHLSGEWGDSSGKKKKRIRENKQDKKSVSRNRSCYLRNDWKSAVPLLWLERVKSQRHWQA